MEINEFAEGRVVRAQGYAFRSVMSRAGELLAYCGYVRLPKGVDVSVADAPEMPEMSFIETINDPANPGEAQLWVGWTWDGYKYSSEDELRAAVVSEVLAAWDRIARAA